MISQYFIETNFTKGKLTLVGGCPGIGKTSFAISLAISMAEQNQKVIYFSLEMTEEQLIKRITLQNEQIAISENIVICDTPFAKMSDVRSQFELQPSDYIIIDYIQLMEAENKELSGEDEVSSIICGLRNLARELRIPIIALSQMSRNGDFGIRSDDLPEINVAILTRSTSDSYHQLLYEPGIGNNSLITHFDFDSNTTDCDSFFQIYKQGEAENLIKE